MRARHLCWIVVLAAGCNDDGAAKKPPPPPARQLAGVYPEKWQCAIVASPDALAEVLGGPVTPIESPMSVPTGVPRPCNYDVAVTGGAHEVWSFDLDCRDGMKPRADALFAQYRQQSEDLVAQYAAQQAEAAKAAAGKHGKRPPDAGVELPPALAVDVDVGAKGLDHHGRGVLFIDDDAPCYVRVVGIDAAKRLALAKLVAKNLTFANAPMTPRAAP